MRYTSVILAFIVLTAGCSTTTKISEIKANPDIYLNSTVTIKGRVTQVVSVPLSSKGFYQLDDGEASLWVYAEHGLPERGEEVEVKGVLKSGLTLLGKTLSVVLIEQERK